MINEHKEFFQMGAMYLVGAIIWFIAWICLDIHQEAIELWFRSHKIDWSYQAGVWQYALVWPVYMVVVPVIVTKIINGLTAEFIETTRQTYIDTCGNKNLIEYVRSRNQAAGCEKSMSHNGGNHGKR